MYYLSVGEDTKIPFTATVVKYLVTLCHEQNLGTCEMIIRSYRFKEEKFMIRLGKLEVEKSIS